LAEIPSAPILFSYFNRANPRFVRNHADAAPLNNWLVIQPKAGVDPDALFEMLTRSETMGRLKTDCRDYGDGLWKLEPRELMALELPQEASQLLPSS
jgi:hypothetical protein